MSTEAQLKALSNSELASGTQIPALKHRTVNNAIIEEMYDAQSRGNVLSGVQTATSLASGDEVFVIRSGEAYLLDADELGFVSTLADLTDVNIPAPSNDQVLAYNFGTSKWMSKDVSSLSSVVSITGTATTNQMVKFTGLSSIGNSIVSDDGTTVNIGGNLSVDNNLTVGTINSGTATDFVKGDGSLDGTTYQDEAEKNQANGYAPLDSGAKIPLANLPDSILGQVSYQGTWAASTNTPTLDNPPASTTKGEYYVASDDGTQFGIEFKTGDWIISNGTAWEKVDNTDAVTSVFGRLGNVIANASDYENFYVDFNSNQSITGQKTFGSGDLRIVSGGSGNLPAIFRNTPAGVHQDAGSNTLGFNVNNDLYFTKGETIDFNGAVLSYDNTGIRTYTLPDASGTFAFTSDLADYVTLDTEQDITGQKTFDNNTLRLEDAGNGLVTVLGNINSNTSTDGGLARFGFNFQNNIFFSKGVSVGFNAGVFAFNNTDARTYTLPDASGTFAFTSDLTTLNASNITTGTLADARLSSNVALKDVNNNFSVGQSITSSSSSGVVALMNNTDATNGFGLKITAGGSAVDRYALHILDPTDTTSYFKIATETGKVGYVGISEPNPAVELDVNGKIRASNGILFGTDTAAANALDDYEEGTWTTTFGTLVNLTGTPSLIGSRYTKIGNLVYLEGRITGLSTVASGALTGVVFSVPFNQNTSLTRAVGTVRAVQAQETVGNIVNNTGANVTEFFVLIPADLQFSGAASVNYDFSLTYSSL